MTELAPKFPGDEGDPFEEEVKGEGAIPPDLQEALSIQYSCQTRIAVLSSGNWAIWFGKAPAPVIVTNLEPEGFRALVIAAQELDQLQREEAAERRRTVAVTVKSTQTLEDLGL